jgi:hypothetical protein
MLLLQAMNALLSKSSSKTKKMREKECSMATSAKLSSMLSSQSQSQLLSHTIQKSHLAVILIWGDT